MAAPSMPHCLHWGHGQDAEPYAGPVKATADRRYRPFLMRVCAVLAEARERARPRRDMTQAQIAPVIMIGARTLRTWTARHLAEGASGPRARGGQGRRPAASGNGMRAAIKGAKERGGFQGAP